MRPLAYAALLFCSSALAATPPAGQTLFQQRCAVCHPRDRSFAQGPGLGGVVGRAAASVPGFAYSPALRASKLRWSRAQLDRFLAAPSEVVPGTTMPIPTPDPGERAALLAFLSTLHDTGGARTATARATTPAGAATKEAPRTVDVSRVREGKAALGDFRDDAPGLQRHLTTAALPAPYATRSQRNGPEVVPMPATAQLRVPPGFVVTPFARGLEHPRLVRTAPNGDLFVAESVAGKVVLLRPDGDVAGPPQLFAGGLDRPFGIAFYPPGPTPQWLYVAENNRIVRFAYRAGDRQARGPKEVVVPKLSDSSEGHWTRDLAFSADGKQLYVSVGSGSNVAEGMEPAPPLPLAEWERRQGLGATWGDELHRADVLVFDGADAADGKPRPARVFASGIRNCVGLALQPETHDLWCATNERDGLGDDLVPDYVTRVRGGAYYGWPWYYLGDHEDPRLRGARPDLAGKATLPDVLIQPHSAALELTFYDGAQFPAEYRGDAFVALHGSWNRSGRTGYKVVRVRTEHGRPTGVYEDFLIGFVVDDDHVWGRPVGVAVAGDGALLVSEDGNGTIWRVSRKAP